MKMMKLSLLVLAGAIQLSACTSDQGREPGEGPTEQEQHVLAVFNRHVAAFESGDLDAVLSDFRDDSIVITADGVLEGLAQIRRLYAGLLAEFGTIDNGDSPGIILDISHVRRDMLFITWHAESRSRVYPFGTDTFIIKRNHIARQTISFPAPGQ